MKTQQLICIVCPNGCEITAQVAQTNGRLKVDDISGGLCEKGIPWAEQELTNPMRTFSSNVLVTGGDMHLVSVRTNRAIPRGKIFEVMERIKQLNVAAPVEIGDILLDGPCDTDCQIIATRRIQRV
jgi:CxxC motif-containing protein